MRLQICLNPSGVNNVDTFDVTFRGKRGAHYCGKMCVWVGVVRKGLIYVDVNNGQPQQRMISEILRESKL